MSKVPITREVFYQNPFSSTLKGVSTLRHYCPQSNTQQYYNWRSAYALYIIRFTVQWLHQIHVSFSSRNDRIKWFFSYYFNVNIMINSWFLINVKFDSLLKKSNSWKFIMKSEKQHWKFKSPQYLKQFVVTGMKYIMVRTEELWKRGAPNTWRI